MSPLQRPVSGSVLGVTLAEEVRTVREQLIATSRSARTLIKNGPLRVTLAGLAAGGEIAPHAAEGPITVHVLDGAIELEAAGKTWRLSAGGLLSLDSGIVHSVRAPEGGIFLLTVVASHAE